MSFDTMSSFSSAGSLEALTLPVIHEDGADLDEDEGNGNAPVEEKNTNTRSPPTSPDVTTSVGTSSSRASIPNDENIDGQKKIVIFDKNNLSFINFIELLVFYIWHMSLEYRQSVLLNIIIFFWYQM